ncbi:hypothetical protein BaRGS_00028963 [Batillaria attramentaria]|uniref:Uncharacterized protein n=1 Tax=Batillaria attramentaria TaxID=370345 RepID=A0ABD0JXY5_9CAEN
MHSRVRSLVPDMKQRYQRGKSHKKQRCFHSIIENVTLRLHSLNTQQSSTKLTVEIDSCGSPSRHTARRVTHDDNHAHIAELTFPDRPITGSSIDQYISMVISIKTNTLTEKNTLICRQVTQANAPQPTLQYLWKEYEQEFEETNADQISDESFFLFSKRVYFSKPHSQVASVFQSRSPRPVKSTKLVLTAQGNDQTAAVPGWMGKSVEGTKAKPLCCQTVNSNTRQEAGGGKTS